MPHPAALSLDDLLADCDLRRTRRGGPGGQHRNKVETAVVITHRPTGISGQAAERRSQDLNRQMAIQRLRVNLALEVRTPPGAESLASDLWLSRVRGGKITVSPEHDDFPALLAEALDRLAACDWDAWRCGEIAGHQRFAARSIPEAGTGCIPTTQPRANAAVPAQCLLPAQVDHVRL